MPAGWGQVNYKFPFESFKANYNLRIHFTVNWFD